MGLAWLTWQLATAWAQTPGICPDGFLLEPPVRCVRWVPLGPAPEVVSRVVVSSRGVYLHGDTKVWTRSIGGDWVPARRSPRMRRHRSTGFPPPVADAVRRRISGGEIALAGHDVWRRASPRASWTRSLPCPVTVGPVDALDDLLVVVGEGQVWALEQRVVPAVPVPVPPHPWAELEEAARSATSAPGADAP